MRTLRRSSLRRAWGTLRTVRSADRKRREDRAFALTHAGRWFGRALRSEKPSDTGVSKQRDTARVALESTGATETFGTGIISLAVA